MSRPIRYIPVGGATVEVTTRTLQGRLLLRPSPELYVILVGVLARAQKLYDVKIHAVVAMSNHIHLLLTVKSAKQLADFMCYFNSNVAREVGRLHDWPGKVWSRRYQAIIVSEEAEAQIVRLRYILAHGAKEGFVWTPSDWPGLNCIQALLTGEPLQGVWYDRTQEHAARQRGEDADSEEFASQLELKLEKLPCWAELTAEAYQERIRELVDDIVRETAERHRCDKTRPLGVRAVLKQDPHYRPEKPKRSPAPLFHAVADEVRKALKEGYSLFLAAYCAAASLLRAGDRTAKFPEGCFPPPLPFIDPVPG